MKNHGKKTSVLLYDELRRRRRRSSFVVVERGTLTVLTTLGTAAFLVPEEPKAETLEVRRAQATANFILLIRMVLVIKRKTDLQGNPIELFFL
jgi:hypothetical protein